MMNCDKDKIKDDKDNDEKRNKRMRLKGSQGVERESCMVSMWAFS